VLTGLAYAGGGASSRSLSSAKTFRVTNRSWAFNWLACRSAWQRPRECFAHCREPRQCSMGDGVLSNNAPMTERSFASAGLLRGRYRHRGRWVSVPRASLATGRCAPLSSGPGLEEALARTAARAV
jgi:hypothetical protein